MIQKQKNGISIWEDADTNTILECDNKNTSILTDKGYLFVSKFMYVTLAICSVVVLVRNLMLWLMI